MTESGKIKQRWKYFFDKLFNAENPREQLDELPTTEGPVECFSLEEVKKQMAKMGKGKACGPDELPIEAVHIILDYKPECIVEAFNNILRTNKMSNDWRKSRMVPILKKRGWCNGMQQLQRYQTDEPYNEAMGKNDRSQTEGDNQDCR